MIKGLPFFVFGEEMKYRHSFIASFIFFGSLVITAVAFAHGAGIHGKPATDDQQMKKLHVMMPMFSQESAKLESALEKRDFSAVQSHCDKILKAMPDLKKSKPHKNLKERKKFVELATNLEQNLINTLNFAQNGDLEGSKAAFKKVETACAACHAKFRD